MEPPSWRWDEEKEGLVKEGGGIKGTERVQGEGK